MKVSKESVDGNITTCTSLLDAYCPRHQLWTCIDDNDIETFKSILTRNSHPFSIPMIVKILMQSISKEDRQEFLQFIIKNDGELNLSLKEYSILIGYCAEKSDISTLELIIETIDKSKYNLTTHFRQRQVWTSSMIADKINCDVYSHVIAPKIALADKKDGYGYLYSSYHRDSDRDKKQKLIEQQVRDMSILHSCISSPVH